MRIEKDSLGELPVPDDAYYGIQTVRCASNYQVTEHTFEELPDVLKAMAEVKKACAITNSQIGVLDAKKAEAICRAADELIAGKFKGQFPINIWRSHGTGVNMNVNEILANRANEILTGKKGYEEVHPNTHVNMCQSSNDVYPTVENIVLYRLSGKTIDAAEHLIKVLASKAEAYKEDVRLGRTCLQDAIPNTFGQVFGAWQHLVFRHCEQLKKFREEYRAVILGSTVLGTGMGEMPGYHEHIMENLSTVVGFNVHWPTWKEEMVEDSSVFDQMQNNDHSMVLCSILKGLALAAARISTDLCILSSGPNHGFGEIRLPQVSRSLPTKTDMHFPFIPEKMFEIMQIIVGNEQICALTANQNDGDETISVGGSFLACIESLELLSSGLRNFADNCISGIEINKEKAANNANLSTSLSTMVSALFGYPVGTRIAHKAYEEGISCRQAALEEGLLPTDIADKLFDIRKLCDRRAMVEMFKKYGNVRNIG